MEGGSKLVSERFELGVPLSSRQSGHRESSVGRANLLFIVNDPP